jgi:restriction system protein
MAEPVDEVASALDLVAGEMESVITDVKEHLRAATDDERFGEIDALREQLVQMRGLTTTVETVRSRWMALRNDRYGAGTTPTVAVAASEPPDRSVRRRNLGRLKQGTKTPEAEFALPILEALVELGGSADIKETLARVHEKLRDRLRPVDHERLPSNPDQVRWYNTAQWCRHTLVKQGLMLPVRRVGVWEISDAGRAWLNGQR